MIKKLIFVAVTFAIGFCQDQADLSDSEKIPIETEFCLLPSNKGYELCIDLYKCGPAWKAFTEFSVKPTYCNSTAVCCNVNAKNGTLKFVQQRISEQSCLNVYPLITPRDTVNLVETKDGEFQHIAAIAWRTQNGGYDYLCGGSLISATFILTAAHCASLKGVAPHSVRIGGVKLNEIGGEGNIAIKKIIIHPKYTIKQVYNDIALFELEKPSSYPPACLWQTTEVLNIEPVAIGYGHTTFAGKGSDVLMKVNLSIYDFRECKYTYQPGFRLEDGLVESQLCAVDRGNIQDTCQGDSGGPLMLKLYQSSPPSPYIVGISSFGQECAPGPPSVYTRVSSFLDWIESIVWPGEKATGYFRVD